jgi:catechol 2,3-dioxygenase-like lactoylglutathione lyase family enzyme
VVSRTPSNEGVTAVPNGSGIQYVEIGAADLSRSLDFYQDLLGFRAAAEAPVPPEPGVRWLSAGPALVRLVDVGAGDLGGWEGDDLQRGIRHLGMKVGDVDLQAERLRDAGVRFTLGPIDAVGDVRLAFFTDPDGTLLEIIDGHLHYHETWSPEIADRERDAAAHRPRTAGPSFDHVAVTVSDLDATLAFYRDTLGYEVIGQLDHAEDSRGFLITYLQAGDAVLEVFTFRAPTTANPWTPEGARLGLRGIGIGDRDATAERLAGAGATRITSAGGGPLLTDIDGIPLRLVAAG